MARTGLLIFVVGVLVVLGASIYMLTGREEAGFGFTTSTPGGSTTTVTVTMTDPSGGVTTTVTTTRIRVTETPTYTSSRPEGSVGWVSVDVLDPEKEPIKGVFLNLFGNRVARFLNITVYEPRHVYCRVLINYIVAFGTDRDIEPQAINANGYTKYFTDITYGSLEISKLKDIYDIIGWNGEGYYTIYVNVKVEYPDGTVLEGFRWAKVTGYWTGSEYQFNDITIIDLEPVVGGH